MKTYKRLVRRRLEAAFKLSLRPVPPPRPAADGDGLVPRVDPFVDDAPVEIIDLATGPFEARFPELATRARGRRAS